MKSRILLIFVAVLWCSQTTPTVAQADISMTTHWYNRSGYNPASIARPNYMYLFANVRQQWTGIAGSPRVSNIQASGYSEALQSAVGLSVVSDQIGATQAINPMVSYAYRISDGENRALSMGLSAGVFARTVNGSLYEADVVDDPAIDYSQVNQTRPDANVGLELQNEHFIVCVSTTHLFSIGRPDSLYLSTNHRYASFIYKNNSASQACNYHVGLQMVNRHNLTVWEGNACVRIKFQTGLIKGPQEVFEAGITYRSSQQLTLLGGVNLTSSLRVGYAYNQSFIAGYYARGTHEIMLEYRLPIAGTWQRQRRNDGYWYN